MTSNGIVQYASGSLPYLLLFTQAPILVWFDGTIIDISTILLQCTTVVMLGVKKMGPLAFSLSTLRNMICAVLGCCGTEQDFYRRLGLGTVRNLLVSVGF